MKTFAIIGRPNVGKSTLFNRLSGSTRAHQQAIVDDTPGVTRDRKIINVELGGIKFKLVDTAGLEKAENNTLQHLMMQQTEMAVDLADVLLLVVDGTAGLTPQDTYFAKWARGKGKPVILLVNKCETKNSSKEEFFRLGFGEPIAISAEHKLGWIELIEAIGSHLGKEKPEEDEKKDAIQIAILGRPNVGKSTIINKILNENRVIVSDVAGTTRDSIYVDWKFRGHDISVGDTLNAVKYASVVILVMDATQAFEQQDLKIADLVINEGRSVILALNKWDLVKDKKGVKEEIEYLVGKQMGRITGVTIVTLSAAKDKNLDPLLAAALKAYEVWNMQVPTSKLNRWLEDVIQEHSPPIVKGRRLKIRYITQVKTRPPTFRMDVSLPEEFPDSYLTYLTRSLRTHFGLQGTPIRFNMPKKANPFAHKKKR
jgi:GTPase